MLFTISCRRLCVPEYLLCASHMLGGISHHDLAAWGAIPQSPFPHREELKPAFQGEVVENHINLPVVQAGPVALGDLVNTFNFSFEPR